MEAKIFNQKGKETGKINLEESVFGLPWNADLVHQVISSITSSSRTPVAHTKDRSEVSGGGKKPWNQKGTGRARHGSTRSPIWVGGGVAHGPRNDKNYDKKINKKAKAKALATILSAKLKDNEIIFVDSLKFDLPKTKEAIDVLTSLSKNGFDKLISKKKNSVVIALSSKEKNTEKSFSNLGNVTVMEARNISPLDILTSKYLLIENPEVSLESLKGRLEIKK